MKTAQKLLKGFTLIELLVVISIIGILTTLIAANLNSARSRARDAERKSDLRNIATALRLYFNDWNAYPLNSAAGGINGCGTGSGTPASPCTWGSPWTNGSVATYMATLPKDPLNTSTSYYFYRRTATDSYQLAACLENQSDPAGAANSLAGLNYNCGSGWIFLITP